MSLSIRMRRALKAFRQDPKQVSVTVPLGVNVKAVEVITMGGGGGGGSGNTQAVVAHGTNGTGVYVNPAPPEPSHNPRAVADELVRIAQYPNVPGPIKNMLRVQVMFLHRWMDMVHGKRDGNPPIDLNPKRN